MNFKLQTLLNFGVSVFGTIISWAFGGWSDLLGFFLLTIAVDYISGVAASVKGGNGLESKKGFWGLARKGLMLLIVLLAHRMDLLMGTTVIMTGAVYFYLSNELISITENYGRLGLPLPGKVRKMIAVLKDKGDAEQ